MYAKVNISMEKVNEIVERIEKNVMPDDDLEHQISFGRWEHSWLVREMML